MKAKAKERVKNGLIMAAVFILIELVMAWMFIAWLESPAEQPITESQWMQEIAR